MLLYDTSIDEVLETNEKLKLCVMTTTVMTPKLTLLLDIIQARYRDSRLSEIAVKIRRESSKFIHKSIKNLAKEMDVGTLRMAAGLYHLYDDVICASSIQEKITAWKTAYTIAQRQTAHISPLQIHITQIPVSLHELCELSDDQICLELYDYADEIEAWLDCYMDEYDDFDDSDETSLYDDALSIMTGLRLISNSVKQGIFN